MTKVKNIQPGQHFRYNGNQYLKVTNGKGGSMALAVVPHILVNRPPKTNNSMEFLGREGTLVANIPTGLKLYPNRVYIEMAPCEDVVKV